MDDNKTMLRKGDVKLLELKGRIEDTYDPKIKKLYAENTKIWKYNLKVPNLIGPEDCPYTNMAEYIGSL